LTDTDKQNSTGKFTKYDSKNRQYRIQQIITTLV